MIDVKKIKLNLPDGVVAEGEISLTGNIATVKLLSSTVGDKTISASYDDGEAVSTVLKVTEATLFNTLVLEPAEKCFTGDTVKLIATFSKVPVLSDVVIDPAIGFTVKSEPKVEGMTVVAEYTAPETPLESGVFNVNFRKNTTVKTANMVVLERPAVLQSVVAEPNKLRITEVTTVTATFDKAPKLSEVTIEPSEGLEVVEEAKVVNATVVVKYKGMTAGPKTVKFTHNKVEQTANLHVYADAVISSVVGEPEPVELGGVVNITVTYDKSRLENQPVMEVQLDAGLAEKTPYAENPEKNGGSMQVLASEPGDKTVTFTLGAKPKVLKITVNPGE